VLLPHLAQETLNKPTMPMHQASCPHCQDNLFVRAEQIISGLRVMQALYCGRCNHEWSVEKPPQNGEERPAAAGSSHKKKKGMKLDSLIP
jgi:hypothetical protein